MSIKKKIAVMAGTKVDTRMGVGFLKEKYPEAEAIFCPVSEDPQEQTLFQVSPDKEKIIGEMMEKAIAEGAEAFFVYCNSLSGAVDFEKLAAEKRTKAVTPLAVYRRLGAKYKRVGVLAANNQSLAKIEENLLAGNSEIEVLGCALLPAVKMIEKGIPPEEIAEKMKLGELVAFLESNGAEAIFLGCTHFPYLKNALEKRAGVPFIDPAESMVGELLSE